MRSRLSWAKTREIASKFKRLNPYKKKIVPGSVLNIVEELNYEVTGKQRQLYGYGISAKRYDLFILDGTRVRIIKPSEHGLGMYFRPKEGRDEECDAPEWIKESWEWITTRALGLPCREPKWFQLPVMRRIAISTPNVMAALRKLDRDQARPYNFALSPVLVNLTDTPITLVGPFEKDPSRWGTMPFVNIHDGTTHTLNPATLLALPQTFAMVLAQYVRHPEHKSLAPDGRVCKSDSDGLLKRYPVTVSGFHLIGKETERGWEHAEDISTLLPSLKRYGRTTSAASQVLRQRLQKASLNCLQSETGLSRNTILRARRGQRVHSRSLHRLQAAAR